VDLIDEEHRPRLERGERGDVALALQGRAGGLHERHVELGGDDLRQRGLAQPRRAGEQHVVERLAARRRRLDRDRELLAQAVLADELPKRAGAHRAIELVLAVEHPGRLQALHRHVRAPLSALASSSSAVSPSAPSSRARASAGPKPRSIRPPRAM
jgi:hypothetical protein